MTDRLKLGTHNAQPSTPQVDSAVRNAFVAVIAAVPPIHKAGVTLSAGFVAALPSDCALVQFAAYQNRLLLDIEWQEIGNDLYVRRGSARAGAAVGIWYQKDYGISDATNEIDTSCVFGQDWLAEPAVTLAAMQALLRMSQSAASRGGDKYASLYRVLQQEYQSLITPLATERAAWLQRQQQRLAQRLALKDGLPTNNRMRGLVNLSRMPNNLTGAE